MLLLPLLLLVLLPLPSPLLLLLLRLLPTVAITMLNSYYNLLCIQIKHVSSKTTVTKNATKLQTKSTTKLQTYIYI